MQYLSCFYLPSIRYQHLLNDIHQCYLDQRELLLGPSIACTVAELTSQNNRDHCALVSACWWARPACSWLFGTCLFPFLAALLPVWLCLLLPEQLPLTLFLQHPVLGNKISQTCLSRLLSFCFPNQRYFLVMIVEMSSVQLCKIASCFFEI